MSPRAASRLESLGFEDVYWYGPGKMDWVAFGLPVEGKLATRLAGDAIRRDAPTCSLVENVADVRPRLGPAGWSQCVVTDERNVVLGRVHRSDLDRDGETPIEQVMESGPSTYRPSVPLEEMLQAMKSGGHETVLITRSDGVFLGLLNRQDAEERSRQK
jgi:CBS domain-containing protein